MTLFRMDQGHILKLKSSFGESKLESSYACMTLIHWTQGHTKLNKTVVYAYQPNLNAVSTVTVRIVSIMFL